MSFTEPWWVHNGVMATTSGNDDRRLDGVSFDQLLATQLPFDGLGVFNLCHYRFVTPAALVQLAAACQAIHNEGRRATIVLNRQSDLPRFMLRANFIHVVRPIATFNPDIKRQHLHDFDHLLGTNQMLVEVTKVESAEALRPLLDHILQTLCDVLRYSERDAFDIAVAVSEIAQNTFDHAGQACGFLAMQVYQRRDGHRFLEIALADCGDGLRATLQRNPKYQDLGSDHEAIRASTLQGVSQFHNDATRGTGLYHLLDKAFQLEGSVYIRSGSAKLRFRMDQRRGWELSVPYMPGVQIMLSLPSKARA